MSARLPRFTAAELLRALARDGWYESSQSGSHVKLRHSSKGGHVVVPRHVGRTLKPKTLQTILDQAGLTPDELRALL